MRRDQRINGFGHCVQQYGTAQRLYTSTTTCQPIAELACGHRPVSPGLAPKDWRGCTDVRSPDQAATRAGRAAWLHPTTTTPNAESHPQPAASHPSCCQLVPPSAPPLPLSTNHTPLTLHQTLHRHGDTLVTPPDSHVGKLASHLMPCAPSVYPPQLPFRTY
jgi:hypothetical protein